MSFEFEQLTAFYPDSGSRIQRGDKVIVDGLGGTIDQVCEPESSVAKDYNCHDTGGLLIQYDDDVLALIPFGNKHSINKK